MYDKSTIAALRDLLYDLSLEGAVITNDADEDEELAERILRCVNEAREETRPFTLNREEADAVGWLLESVLRNVQVNRDCIPQDTWTSLDSLFRRLLGEYAPPEPVRVRACSRFKPSDGNHPMNVTRN